jgi:uncharacterized membrane protein
MESVKTLLERSGDIVSVILEFTSVICIIVGFGTALYILIKSKQNRSTPLHRRLKISFGGWLSLALEFQLASDIVLTTVAPTYQNLIMLGAVAVIRTFLSYFLNREIKENLEMLKINAKEGTKETE